MFALLGTFSVVTMFWRMRFLPALNISDIGLVACAIVFFSTLMVVIVVTVVFLPFFSIQPWLKALPPGQSSRKEASGSTARPGFRAEAIIAAGGALAVVLVWLAFFIWSTDKPVFILILVGIGLATFLFTLWAEPDLAGGEQGGAPWYGRIGIRILAATCLYLFFIPVITWVMLGTHEAAIHVNAPQFVCACALVIFVHCLLAATQHYPGRTRAIIAVASAGFLLFVAGTLFEALDRAAMVFRLGMIPKQSVVVGEKECRIARAARVVSVCSKLEGPGDALYELRDIVIVSRLGSQMVLADSKWKPLDPTASVVLPSDKIHAWYTTQDPLDPPAAVQTPATDVAPAKEPVPPKPRPKPRRQAKARSAPSC
jgi:hypothetical protein